MKYDYLVVGAGLFGATFTRLMLDQGKRVLVVDKRDHIAGNCFSEKKHGIHVHRYGPHVFHTTRRDIWDFANRFAAFNHFRLHPKASVGGDLFSIPPNLILFRQLWGVKTPLEAQQHLNRVRVPCDRPENLKAFVLDAVGPEVYEKFYEGYSRKQWGRGPADIPVAVGRRLPIRLTFNDRWFDDPYEGVPIGGYTQWIANMLDGADLELGVDFLDNREELERRATKTLFMGRIDEHFDFKHGDLEYRSLRFENEVHEGDHQGNAVINFTDERVPYTRIIEHKHFEFSDNPISVITKEYPQACGRGDVPYHPMRDAENAVLHRKYTDEAKKLRAVLFGGRLGSYLYYDMDMAIAAAMTVARSELNGRGTGL